MKPPLDETLLSNPEDTLGSDLAWRTDLQIAQITTNPEVQSVRGGGPLRVGELADRYLVEEVLGRGATAVVYRVQHVTLGSQHALKMLMDPRPELRTRLIQEGRIQSGLRHPNLVAVTDVLSIRGWTGLLMEYVDGPSLHQWLEDHRPDAAQAEALLRTILDGLEAAHVAGVVHRDLKPGNVMLDGATLTPRITDFGLAKHLVSPEVGATRSGASMGTPAFMAPEQISDASRVDERADLFSLGCIFYELCCGRRAFPGSSVGEVYANIQRGLYTPPEQWEPELSVNHRELIRRCLSVDRDRRPESCAAVRRLLDGDVPQRPRPARAPEPRSSSRRQAEALSLHVTPSGGVTLRLLDREKEREGPRLDALTCGTAEARRAEMRSLLGELRPQAPASLLRLATSPKLAELPWEEATAPGVRLVRAVPSTRPAVPRELTGPLRVLACTPDPRVAETLSSALNAIEDLRWLPPLTGAEARLEPLIARLATPPGPHVLLLDAPGGRLPDASGELRSAGHLAAKLERRLCRDLRLLVALSPCSAGDCASLASDGVSAVLSWSAPTATDRQARTLAAWLTALSRSGDVDRMREASPVDGQRVWLRGRRPALFTRQSAPPGALSDAERPLEALLALPGSVVILGDALTAPRDDDAHAALRAAASTALAAGAELSLPALLQSYELQAGRPRLRALLEGALQPSSSSRSALLGLARHASPGLFISLLWRPALEEALAETWPRRRVIVLQATQPARLDQLQELRREPGAPRWMRAQRGVRERLDFELDYVVLRLFGGLALPAGGLLGEPVLTEDDLLTLLASLERLPPQLLSALRRRPVAAIGLRPERWGHREVLRRLTDEQPLPEGSLAVLPPEATPATRGYWKGQRGPAGRRLGLRTLDSEALLSLVTLGRGE